MYVIRSYYGARHLDAVGLRYTGEVVGDAFARAWPGRIRVRVVGRPHEIVHAHEFARKHADAVGDLV